MSICFLHEWNDAQGRPRAIPHMTTANTSFLRTAMLLKSMSIDNYAFPLCLYDPDLLHVDVHDLEENTPENENLRRKVMIEARRNVWYYLRECIRIYEQGGKPVRFRLDRGSCAMTWWFTNGIDYTSMQPRQTGKTVCALALTSHVLYISGEDYQCGMMTKDNALRQINVKRVRDFGDYLPAWWMAKDRNKDKLNAEEIYYSALKTHYLTFVAQSEKGAADKQGRGGSFPFVHFDELEYIINIGISYPTILSSGGAARVNAKRNNKPHSNLITTTAGDPSTAACREAMAILDGAMAHNEHFYDVENLEKLHDIVEAASPQKMVLGVFSHLQLGYDNKWLRDQILRNKLTKEQTERDFLNRRVSIQEKPVIPKDVLSKINSSQRDHPYIQIISSKFVIYWYIPKDQVNSQYFKNKPIVVGCDSSEMIGRDSTTLIGVDPTDLSVVFSFRSSEGNISVVGTIIAQLLLTFPKMIFVPENKSSGTSIIDIVTMILRKEGHNPFTRIFNWVVNNRHEKEFASINIRDTALLDTHIKKYFGIKTDKTKRDDLYSRVLLEGTALAADKIRDQNLIRELNSLTVRNGRVDHGVGSNDDTVIAFLMAMWFILNARHLDIYGVDPGSNMKYVTRSDHGENDRLLLERQDKIRAQIDDLVDKLKYQKDPSYRKLIEADIGLLRGTSTDTSTRR